MASTKEYLDFVLEQLSGLDEISSRAMMGEFILYYRGKVFGGIYDDRLLVKPVPVAVKMMPDAEMEPPYDGAKKMILVDDVDNRQFLCELVESMWEELQVTLDKNKQIFYINSGDFIPKSRKYKCTNGAQTLVVWAFFNSVENLRTTISKKSIIIL